MLYFWNRQMNSEIARLRLFSILTAPLYRLSEGTAYAMRGPCGWFAWVRVFYIQQVIFLRSQCSCRVVMYVKEVSLIGGPDLGCWPLQLAFYHFQAPLICELIPPSIVFLSSSLRSPIRFLELGAVDETVSKTCLLDAIHK